MQIEFSKNSVKYINAVDKPTKKRLKEAIPEPGELEALRAGREDRAVNGTIPYEAINWD